MKPFIANPIQIKHYLKKKKYDTNGKYTVQDKTKEDQIFQTLTCLRSVWLEIGISPYFPNAVFPLIQHMEIYAEKGFG